MLGILDAIDGTSIRLPNNPDITKYFGIQKGREGQAGCTMGMASVFYDVLNHLVIDSCIHPRTKSEKACVSEHLGANASKNDLIIYNRGYPAFWLYAFHLKHNHTLYLVMSGLFGKRIEVPSIAHKRKPFHVFKPLDCLYFLKPLMTKKLHRRLSQNLPFFSPESRFPIPHLSH
jgi:hypothetical protein